MARRIVYPLVGAGEFTNNYGAPRTGHRHKGIDIPAPEGTPIVAVQDGKITAAGESGASGIRVWINGTWFYAHLSKLAVRSGDKVKAGQIIGYVGHTGDATGPHLHFGWSPDGSSGQHWENPYSLLRTASDAPAPAEAPSSPPVDAAAPADGQGDVALNLPQTQPPPTALGVQAAQPALPGSESFQLEQFNPAQTWKLLASDPMASPETQYFASLLGN